MTPGKYKTAATHCQMNAIFDDVIIPDSVLSLILDLLNYEIMHSHFPSSVKPCTLTTIYKRGANSNLANYH